ncbi:hypothetical protein DCAR_0624112 [Daucus carota subsp. sativus]|uniref:Uncharacterized protein n=1 Tax=Daucus carota subsp. sativus TaxID=79200 RepID=A0A161ZS57_DAUCS|nr:hypothetical protein DCAR_0624112 [Daucus carota subsp. sativus]
MEVMVPLAARDFSFDSSNSVPLSPRGFSYYFDQNGGGKYRDSEAFTFSIRGDLNSASADELFDNGKIRSGEPIRKKIIASFGRNNKVCSEHSTVSKENAKELSSAGSNVGWLEKKWKLKYMFPKKLKEEDMKNSSAKKKKNERGVVALSAHERHYKVKRAAAEEMRRRTFLPYKQNLMIGCVDFAAAGVSDPSRASIKVSF